MFLYNVCLYWFIIIFVNLCKMAAQHRRHLTSLRSEGTRGEKQELVTEINGSEPFVLARSDSSPLRFSTLRFAPGVPLRFRGNKDRRELGRASLNKKVPFGLNGHFQVINDA